MRADKTTDESVSEARRRFLETCGRFSIATPPAIALLLAASKHNYAVAHSGGGGGGGRGDHDHDHDDHHHNHDEHHGNNGFGNGGHDGVPGHSHHEDRDR